MAYLQRGCVESAWLNINIDGVGLLDSATAVSPIDVPDGVGHATDRMLEDSPGLVRGEPWFQGDHSIFLQHGVPAIAISSEWLLENLATQEITHTARDRIDIVDVETLVELAHGLQDLLAHLEEKLDAAGV